MESDIYRNGYEYYVSACKPQHNTGGFHQLSARESAEALRKGLLSRQSQGGWIARRGYECDAEEEMGMSSECHRPRLRDRMLFDQSRLGTVFMLNEPG